MTTVKPVATDDIVEICLVYIGELLCGLDIREVLEICLHTQIAPVPGALPFVRGVANLRGQIVPIIDLARRLELRAGDHSEEQVLIVGDGENKVGLLVNEVDTVLNVEPGLYEPSLGQHGIPKQRFFRGVYKLEQQLVALLNLEEILNINAYIQRDDKK